MSAAFIFRDFTCWGTNGTVESYLNRLRQHATSLAGIDETPRFWLTKECAGFYPGADLRLDQVLTKPSLIKEFLGLFEQATVEFLADDTLLEIARQWLAEAPKLQSYLHGILAEQQL